MANYPSEQIKKARYVDMTPNQRQARYDEFAEAHEVHVMGFANRPYRGRTINRTGENTKTKKPYDLTCPKCNGKGFYTE